MIESSRFTNGKSGVRLDAALAAFFTGSSRALCREACDSGLVKVNSRPAPKGLKLRGGETIEVERLAETCDIRIRPNPRIEVACIFEDNDILAFDKPPCQSVQPLSRTEDSTLMNGVAARWPECAEPYEDATPLMGGAIHRIDAGTSGLVLAARNAAAYASMRAQFSEQRVEKTYLALVEGRTAVGGTLENDLVHDPSLPYCRMIDAARFRGGVRMPVPMHAVTNFKPIGWTQCGAEDRTLLEVKIFTGVTHQIRVQLALAGMHIVNDRLYGAFAVEDAKGHALHALSARFAHPSSGDECVISTQWPRWAMEALG